MQKNKKIKKASFVFVRCVWGLFCGSASIDQESNNISLFNIIDQINISKKNFPKQNESKIIPSNYEIVVLLRRLLNLDIDNEKFNIDIKLKLIDPNNKILREIVAPLEFERDKRNMRFRFKMDSFVVTIPGDYFYKIEIKQLEDKDFKTSYEIPFEVRSV